MIKITKMELNNEDRIIVKVYSDMDMLNSFYIIKEDINERKDYFSGEARG